MSYSLTQNASILITGGYGVLGTALRHFFLSKGIKFIAPTRQELDLLNNQATEEYIENHKPEIVIHLAATVFGLGGNLKNQMYSANCNTLINHNLLTALYKTPPKKIFFAGTVASYPFPFKSLPLREEHFFDGLPHEGEFGYAMAKKHAYTYLKILKEEKNTDFIYGILTNLFGKYDNFDIHNGHVIPSLMAKAFQASRQNEALEVWGKRETERDFLYAEEAAKAIYFLLHMTQANNNLINISSGKAYSIKYVSQLIAQAAGLHKENVFQHDMPSGIPNRVVSNQKILELGFEFSMDFEEAIKETYQWYATESKKAVNVLEDIQ